MIWCFGFFFLWLLCGFDEEPKQRCEALRMMTLVTKTVQRPDSIHDGQDLLDKLSPFRYWYGTGGNVIHVAVGDDDCSGKRVHRMLLSRFTQVPWALPLANLGLDFWFLLLFQVQKSRVRTRSSQTLALPWTVSWFYTSRRCGSGETTIWFK